jgi:cyclic beta-1,2-glucan synthetase
MMFDVDAAVENLRRLSRLGSLSTYGFYEAVDFTPNGNGEAKGHVVVRNWMAHHQGMSLVAAANVLCNSVMQRRFHAEPRVAAIEHLLHERQPRVLPYEEAAEVMKKSGRAFADLTVPQPVFRNLLPKAL